MFALINDDFGGSWEETLIFVVSNLTDEEFARVYSATIPDDGRQRYGMLQQRLI